MSNCDHIVIDLNQHILHIGLNRPEKKNALTPAMYQAITAALLEADKNTDIKCVFLHGTADCFSAGSDLSGFDNRDPNQPSPASQLIKVMHAFSKPIVAAITGLAVGIGTTMLFHCDLVYATPDTRFRMPFINLGACPEAGSSLILPATVGLRQAAEVLMLGDFFSTDTAIELGIVNQSINTDQVYAHALGKATQLAEKPAQALIVTKRLLKQETHAALESRIDQELSLFNELLQTPESIEARARLKRPMKKTTA